MKPKLLKNPLYSTKYPILAKNKGAIIPVGLDLIEDADVDVVAAIHELFDVAKTRARNAEIIAAAKPVLPK